MNRNSALRWFPPIASAGLPVPHTLMVPYSHYDILPIFDGEPSQEFDRLKEAVGNAAIEVGIPSFLRTDLTSAKHCGPGAYCITDAAKCGQQIFKTLEDTEMKFFMERAGPEAMIVREFLILDAPFTAFHGLPIAREWRIFTDDAHLFCQHPYWPTEALEGHVDSVVDWKKQLTELHREPQGVDLGAMAMQAVKACGGGEWSVDFACDVAGKWWLIDMATMRDSYHWPGCDKSKTKEGLS